MMYKVPVIFSLLVILVLSVTIMAQVTVEEILIDNNEIKRKFEEAERKYNSVEQAKSIIDFNEIITLLDAVYKEDNINEYQLKILKKSYEYRASAYFNIGEGEKARDDIRSILQIDIDYIPAKETSRKFQKLFQDIADSMTGFFSIKTIPEGSKILIEDKLVGLSNTPLIRYRTGVFTVRALLEGYTEAQQEIEIKAGKKTEVMLEMTRADALLRIQTVPTDVKIYLDGKYIGSSSGQAANKQIEDLKKLGIDPVQCSAIFNSPYLKTGRYKLEFKKPCYKTMVLNVTVEHPQDYDLEPIILDRSQGQIVFKDVSLDAEIYLNGLFQGKGDLELMNLCTGPYTVVVRYPTGKYLKQFILNKDETVIISPSVKPTLFFGGVIGSESDAVIEGDLASKIQAELEKIQTLNIYFPDMDDNIDLDALQRDITKIYESINITDSKPFHTLIGSAESTKNQSLQKYDAELLLFVKLLSDDEAVTILFHNSHGTADLIRFCNACDDYSTAKTLSEVISILDRCDPMISPWLGLVPVDTDLNEGIFIAEVVDGSPSTKSGISQGDYLTFLNSRRITDMRRYKEVLSGLELNKSVPVKVTRNGTVFDFQIIPSLTPLTPEHNDGNLFYNRILADIFTGKTAIQVKDLLSISAFLKAVIYYYLNSFTISEKYLKDITEEESFYLNPGNKHFFLSLVYSKLGDQVSAAAEREKYIKYRNARLYDNSGTPLYLLDRYQIYP